MTENRENLTEFTKWNELPPEMKIGCIKTLDLKTIWKMRSTSKSERALIDSQRISFHDAVFWFNPDCNHFMSSRFENGPTEVYSILPFEKAVSFYDYFLNHGNYRSLKIGAIGTDVEMPPPSRPYSVKNLELAFENQDGVLYWLNRVNDGLDSIKITVPCRNIDIDFGNTFENVLSHQKVINTKFLQISHVTCPNFLWTQAQNWVTQNMEIGRTIQCTLPALFSAFKSFKLILKNRIFSEKPGKVRITTENPEKHILLERGNSRFPLALEFLRLSVIPAEMKEEEYDKEEKWVRILESEVQDEESDGEEEENEEDEEEDEGRNEENLNAYMNAIGIIQRMLRNYNREAEEREQQLEGEVSDEDVEGEGDEEEEEEENDDN